MLLGVKIKNFDVFDDDQMGILMEDSIRMRNETNVLKLRNLNALIGRNQTGKTCFINAMSFIKRCVLSDIAQASKADNRPGFINLLIDKNQPAEFTLFFKIRENRSSKYMQYELVVEANEFGSPIVKSEKIKYSKGTHDAIKIYTLLNMEYGKGFIYDARDIENKDHQETSITNEHQTALSVYGQIGNYGHIADLYHEIYRWFFCRFSSEFSTSYYSDGGAPGGHKHLSSSGSNVNNVIEYMRAKDEEGTDRLIESIKSKIPAMSSKKPLPTKLISSPDKLFLYLLLLADRDPHTTIFMETPDKDLYHDMVDILSNEMREFTIKNKHSQIIFTTHNPYIVESISPREIWVFKRDFESEEDDSVNISCAAADPLVEAMFKEGVGMGAIWYGGHLDAGEDE